MKKKRKFLVAALLLILIIGGILLGRFIYKNSVLREIVQNKKDETAKNDVVATVEGETLTESECRVYLVALQSRVEGIYGSEIWGYEVNEEGETYKEMLKDQLLEKLIYIKVVCANAEDYGVEFNSEDQVEVNGYVTDFFSSISETTADKYSLSKELVTGIYRDNVLATKVYNKITLGYEVETTLEECRQGDFYYMTFNKYYTDDNGNIQYYIGDDLDALKAKVDEALAAATNGDFLTAATNYSDDPEATITCGTETLPDDIEEDVMSLATGQLSGVLETDDAYYIYYCVAANNETASSTVYQLAVEEERNKYFANLYTEWYNKADIDIDTEKWEEVDF